MVAGPLGPNATPGNSIETLYVDIAARADQLVAEAKAAVDKVIAELDRIEEKTEEMNAGGGIGGILRGALSAGLGFGLAQVGIAGLSGVIGKVKELGGQLISTNAQMQMFTQSFTVLTGSAEEAGEIIEWVKDQAKKTPFDVPGLIQASQMLMTWGLDLKEWFTVVGDVAAGMQRPISQVVNAVGTLATGQTGEAVRRFRDLGINLRESMDLTFDARGALITPLEEAIPIVKRIMEERFGGMMAAQSKTWSGVMSNIGDAWQQLIQVTGEPLFEGLNDMLVGLEAWISDNQDQLMDMAQGLGKALGDVLTAMMGIVEQLGSFIGEVGQLIAMIPGLKPLMDLYQSRGGLSGAWGTVRKSWAITAAPVVGGIRTLSGIISGKDQVEGLSGAADLLKKNMGDVLVEVSGVNQELQEQADIIMGEVTPAIQAGIDAIRELGGAYSDQSDGALMAEAAAGQVAESVAATFDVIGNSMPGFKELAAVMRENAGSAIEAADAFQQAKEEVDALEAAAARAEAALAEQQAAIEEAAAIGEKAAKKLQDRLEGMLEDLTQAGDQAAQQLQTDLADIEAKAGEKQLEATTRANEAIADARAKFAREQIRRQEEFNRSWVRLIREQNDANVDAEADYQYQRENLIIEGDEKALADLDARHEMEKDRRQRDQGQARSDLQENYESQVAAAQEAHNEQIRMLEVRLQEELTRIQAEAEAEKEAKIKAEQEAADKRQEKAEELYQRLGEMLYDSTEGNRVAADMVLQYWANTYSGIETEAIWSAYNAEAAMNRVIEQAIAAQAQLQALALQSDTVLGDINYYNNGVREYAIGGYTPATSQLIRSHPGEFMSSPATTKALERALGTPLTQDRIQRMAADLRKRVEVTVTGRGLGGAAAIDELRRELIAAFSQEVTEF